jgi:hypothetical protein
MATVTEVDRPRSSMNAGGPARTMCDMPPRRTPDDTQPEGPPRGTTTKITPRQETHRQIYWAAHVLEILRLPRD